MKSISAKQRQILDYIKEVVNKKGYPPSVREIGAAVNLKSTSTVHGHLEKLEANGYIKRDALKPRAIAIFDEVTGLTRKELVNVPIVGTVTAGQPILAVENIEDSFPLSVEYINNDDVFMLRVKGDSMVKAGILDKDLILVREQPSANNGDIVVALIDDSATVKRFFKEKDKFRLQPENDAMDPIIVDEVSILGKVTGLFRKF